MNGDGVVTTTIQLNSATLEDVELPPRMRRRSTEGRQSGRSNLLWNRTSFQPEHEMDVNLIEDPTPYDSIESEIGITTNRAYQEDSGNERDVYYNRSVTPYRRESPIDTIVLSPGTATDEKTPPTPSTVPAGTSAAATIDMPMMSNSPSDDFMYALEHVL